MRKKDIAYFKTNEILLLSVTRFSYNSQQVVYEHIISMNKIQYRYFHFLGIILCSYFYILKGKEFGNIKYWTSLKRIFSNSCYLFCVSSTSIFIRIECARSTHRVWVFVAPKILYICMTTINHFPVFYITTVHPLRENHTSTLFSSCIWIFFPCGFMQLNEKDCYIYLRWRKIL